LRQSSSKTRFWFAAKRFGLGWGIPVTWQGWATVIVYAALLSAGMMSLPTRESRLLCLTLLSVALIAVVVWKGERTEQRRQRHR
jgi:hypothetical protein